MNAHRLSVTRVPAAAAARPPAGDGAAPRRLRSRLLAAIVLASLLPLGACSIEPWVKPYDRERLADPIMKAERDTIAEKHHEHIYNVREGARGATAVQGGGCGCN